MIFLSDHNQNDQTLKACHSIRGCIDSVINLAPDKSIFVESGGYLGNTTKFVVQKLLDSGKRFQYFVIDNWKLDNVTERHDDNLQFFKDNIGDEILTHIDIICSDSLEAISQFDDNSVFFTFLDDSHVYQHVTKQIPLWVPKIVDGGILAGDDFYSLEVKRAVYDHFHAADVIDIFNAGFAILDPKRKIINGN